MQVSPRIDELRQKFHENPRRYFAPLANEYRKAGDPEQAIAICRAHLAQQPGHMSGHVVYGQALHDAKRSEEEVKEGLIHSMGFVPEGYRYSVPAQFGGDGFINLAILPAPRAGSEDNGSRNLGLDHYGILIRDPLSVVRAMGQASPCSIVASWLAVAVASASMLCMITES